MSEKKTPKLVKGAGNNCTAKGGPSKCRYHSKQFKKHPLAKQYRTMDDIFIAVEKELKPSYVVESLYADNSERANAKVAFKMKQDEALEQFEDDEKYAIYSFSDAYGSNRIRTVLLNPEKTFAFNDESMETIHRKINSIDKAITNHGIDLAGTPVWRGVPKLEYELQDIEVGKEIKFQSYTSTSIDAETAISFTTPEHPILLKVKAKKGLEMGGYHGTEQEVLLPRNKSFRVVSIQENVHVNRVDFSFNKPPVVKGVTLIEIEEL